MVEWVAFELELSAISSRVKKNIAGSKGALHFSLDVKNEKATPFFCRRMGSN
jgi:hypothetical protein